MSFCGRWTALAFGLLIVALCLEGCGPATATDYDATTTTALVFGIVFLVFFCCWSLFLCIGYDVEEHKKEPCWWLCFGVLPFLVVVIWPWIAWGIYASGRNCKTLQAMQPDFCEAWRSPAPVGFTEKLCCVPPTTTSTIAGCEGMRLSNQSSSCESLGLTWVIPYPTGDTLEECCVSTTTESSNVATTIRSGSVGSNFSATLTTITTTFTNTEIPNVATIPYCQCSPTGSNISQCETGVGNACSNPDMEEKTSCFEDGTLCAAATGCKTEHDYQGTGVHCDYPNATDCEKRLHCYWEPSAFVYAVACQRGVSVASATADCAVLASKNECNEQPVCKWELFEQIQQRCANNGTVVGCLPVGATQALRERCARHQSQAACSTDSDLCQWEGLCSCPLAFFGDTCEKERVEFHSFDGLCPANQANAPVCKGLVIAAVKGDQPFCSAQQDCTIWQEVKGIVSKMYEAELGDLVADGFAILGLMVCAALLKILKSDKEHKAIRMCVAVVSVLTFIIDITMEWILVTTVNGAADAIAELKEAMCLSQGKGYDSLVDLENLAEAIATFAYINVGLAIVGGLFDLWQFFSEIKFSEGKVQWVGVAVAAVAAGLELLLSLVNFFSNTIQFVEDIQAIEEEVVGLQGLESGHLCFARHPSLPPAEMVGVPWQQPLLFVVLPSSLLLGISIIAACLTKYTPLSGIIESRI